MPSKSLKAIRSYHRIFGHVVVFSTVASALAGGANARRWLPCSSSLTTIATSTSSSLSSLSSTFVPEGSSTSSSNSTESNILISKGLKNLGNTCYMNAQLQSAFHIPAVRSAILSTTTTTVAVDNSSTTDDDRDSDEPTSIDDNCTAASEKTDDSMHPPTIAAIAMKELFEGMVSNSETDPSLSTSKSSTGPVSLEESISFGSVSSGGKVAYSPRNFVTQLGIPPMVQQDSQEFWKLILPAIGSDKLTDLYKGIYEDYIVALDGSGHERRKDEVFLDLSVDVTGSESVYESLMTTFGRPELLSVKEGNGWRPVKGGDKIDAHKGSSLVADALPPILQVHLKRFNYDWETGRITKLNKQVTFEDTLDLSAICSNTTKNSVKGIGEETSNTQYDLQSVVVHVGEFDVGHYYAYVRPDIRSSRWYRFNDHVVEEVSFDDVRRDAFGEKVTKRILEQTALKVSPESTSATLSSSRTAIKSTFGGRKRNRIGMFNRFRLVGRRKNPYGWGGKTSNAYILQYVRRSDIPMLYDTKS